MTISDLVQDAKKALAVLIQQPEVDANRITILGHSEGTVIAPRCAFDYPVTVKHIFLIRAGAQYISELI